MKKKSSLLIFIVLIVFIISGCKRDYKKENVIYTSLYPVKYITDEIVKDKFEVRYVGQSNMDVHNFELSAKEVADISDAKALVINGFGLESWLDTISKSIEDIYLIDSSKSVKPIIKDEISYDPHIWLSPKNYIIQAKNIYENIVKLDEGNKDFYKENYINLIEKLEKLDENYEKELEKFKGDKLIVAHEAFGYLARDYNLEQIPINSLGNEDEPSMKTVSKVVEYMKDNNLSVIYTEKGESEKIPNVIANEINGEVLELYTLEHLSEDEIKEGKNYFTMMEDNLKVLVNSLGR